MSIKVLAIDDDPGMTQLIKLFLKDDQFDVCVINSGLEGIEIARRWQPDIIVLDLMMPVMSGWEVCREIRAFSQIPILILSVITEEELLIQALVNGANSHISKPITKKELVANIVKLSKQAQTNDPSNAELEK